MTRLPDEEVTRRFLRLAPPYVRVALAVFLAALLAGAATSALVGGLFYLSLALVVGIVAAVLLLMLPAFQAHRRKD
ncbi:MAG: hypothetical protein D6757_07225 [Alphaproteobacteria bacterium]|nr:MAG: hypothetical protein D6757_07225 [Alphaproteobacteria bacterium]